jgi:hypothetical protein
MAELRTTEQADHLTEDGGSFFVPGVQSRPNTGDAFRCPSCKEQYPSVGTCSGYGPDKHPPARTERLDG